MTTQHWLAGTDRGAMIDQLRSQVSGPVLVRGDDDYVAEIAAQNTAVVHTPEVVVGAASEDDAVAAVRAATDNGLPIRVLRHRPWVTQGGRPTACSSRRPGCSDLTIDAESRVAHIGAGCRWAKVVEAAAELGLAPSPVRPATSEPSGTCSVVGSGRWPGPSASRRTGRADSVSSPRPERW